MDTRPVFWVSVAGLLFFGGLRAWMRFEGVADAEIRNVLLGWLMLAALFSFWSAGWHGGGLSVWLVIMLPLSLCCGVSILAIAHPLLAGVLVFGIAVLYGVLEYQRHLDTPYGASYRPVREIPGFGAVIVHGKTPRQVREEVKRLRQKHEP